MSLALFLAGTSGLLVACALMSVLVLTVAANFQNTFTLLNDKAVLVMETLTERITGRVENVEPAVSELTRFYADGVIEVTPTDTREALLKGMLSGAPAIQAIVFYDTDFAASGIFRDEDGSFKTTSRENSVSREVEDALDTVKLGDPPRWGPPLNVGGQTYMNVAAPLSRKGRLDGYVVAAVSISGFSKIVEEVGRRNDGAVALLYGDNTLFAQTTLAGVPVALNPTREQPTIPLADSRDPVLKQFAGRRELSGFSRAQLAGVSVSNIVAGDESYVVMSQAITGYGPEPWIAVLYRPAYEVMDEVHRLRGSFMIGLVLLIASVIVAIFTARGIARAIGRIAPEAERIARLELDAVRQLPGSRIHEVDTEARAFNAMVDGLRTFSIYVPKQLVRRLIQRGFADATRSRAREATVMFTDIVGFTALSERMSAEEAASRLNAHFDGLVSCVEEEFGIVDKFMGDGMMAFWAANDVPDHADRAVRAALAIAKKVEACTAKARAEGDVELRIRIGLHTGSVIVGNLGGADRVNYTIVGDTVNVAARLESFGRNVDPDADATILASAETVAHLSFETRRESVGAVRLTGREAEVDVWRLFGVDCEPASPHSEAIAQQGA